MAKVATPIIYDNEIVKATDQNFIGDNAYENLNILLGLFSSVGSNNLIMDGFNCQQRSTPSLNVDVTIGLAFDVTLRQVLINETLVGPVPFEEADLTNNRIDVVEARRSSVDYDNQQRAFKHPITGVISYSNEYVKKQFITEYKVVKGTAAGSPVAPSVEAGWVKIAEVTVRANATTILNSDIVNCTATYEGDGNTGWTTDLGSSFRLGSSSELKTFFGDWITTNQEQEIADVNLLKYRISAVAKTFLDAYGLGVMLVEKAGDVVQGADVTHINIPASVGIAETTDAGPPQQYAKVSCPVTNAFSLSGATLDNTTVNYVKLTYSDPDSYTLSCNSTAPTNKNIVLATLVGNGTSTLVITNKYPSSTQKYLFEQNSNYTSAALQADSAIYCIPTADITVDISVGAVRKNISCMIWNKSAGTYQITVHLKAGGTGSGYDVYLKKDEWVQVEWDGSVWVITNDAFRENISGTLSNVYYPVGSNVYKVFTAMSSDGVKLAIAVQNDYVYTSINSGGSWTKQTNSGARVWSGITSSSDGVKLAASVSSDTHVYTSTDSGATWATRNSTIAGDCICGSSDGTKLYIASNGSYVYASTDSGATWNSKTNSAQRWWAGITCSSDGTIVAACVTFAGSQHVHISTDSGGTWSEKSGMGANNWDSISMCGDGTKIIVSSTVTNVTPYISIDTGANWNSVTALGSHLFVVSISSDGNRLLAGYRSVTGSGSVEFIYSSPISATTWTKHYPTTVCDWSSISQSSNGYNYLVGSGGSLISRVLSNTLFYNINVSGKDKYVEMNQTCYTELNIPVSSDHVGRKIIVRNKTTPGTGRTVIIPASGTINGYSTWTICGDKAFIELLATASEWVVVNGTTKFMFCNAGGNLSAWDVSGVNPGTTWGNETNVFDNISLPQNIKGVYVFIQVLADNTTAGSLSIRPKGTTSIDVYQNFVLAPASSWNGHRSYIPIGLGANAGKFEIMDGSSVGQGVSSLYVRYIGFDYDF